MKRLVVSIVSALCLLFAGLGSSVASAANTNWALSVSKLGTYTTSRTFNVQYTILTIESGTNYCVQLHQDGVAGAVPTQNTLNPSDSNTQHGNSGTFPVSVPADGTYNFTVQAFSGSCENSEDTKSANVSTIVDTTAPGAPNYLGKTAAGSGTVIRFTAPSDGDVATVNIYSANTKTYDADASHQIGSVAVQPGQTYSQTVNAGSGMYFSVEAFDNAGNGSPVVGDPGTVVHPVVTGGQGTGGAITTAAAEGTTGGTGVASGQVQGTSTGNGSGNGSVSNGQVNAPGSNSTKKNPGKVLGIATTTHSGNAIWWYVAAAIAAVLLASYYWVARRRRTTP